MNKTWNLSINLHKYGWSSSAELQFGCLAGVKDGADGDTLPGWSANPHGFSQAFIITSGDWNPWDFSTPINACDPD
jgi:hypothetical protein